MQRRHIILRCVLALSVTCGLMTALPGVAEARTIILDASYSDRMAVIAADAPRMSWAASEPEGDGVFTTGELDLRPGRALLIRYDLDAIPQTMQITRAEWILPAPELSRGQSDARIMVWRIIPEWGRGVCHQYRQISETGERLTWAQAGGQALGMDRALQPSVTVTMESGEERTINVTQDVAMWHSGAAPNNGWMVVLDESVSRCRFPSPALNGGREQWRLRITYEPR